MSTICRVEGAPRAILGYDETTGNPIAVLSLQCSTTAQLPSIGDTVEGYIVAAGTIAQLIQDGKWVTLDGDDDWYDENGNEVA